MKSFPIFLKKWVLGLCSIDSFSPPQTFKEEMGSINCSTEKKQKHPWNLHKSFLKLGIFLKIKSDQGHKVTVREQSPLCI